MLNCFIQMLRAYYWYQPEFHENGAKPRGECCLFRRDLSWRTHVQPGVCVCLCVPMWFARVCARPSMRVCAHVRTCVREKGRERERERGRSRSGAWDNDPPKCRREWGRGEKERVWKIDLLTMMCLLHRTVVDGRCVINVWEGSALLVKRTLWEHCESHLHRRGETVIFTSERR